MSSENKYVNDQYKGFFEDSLSKTDPDLFKARQDAARAFEIRQQSLAGLAPQVAGQTALQQQAQTLAQQGVGSFQPFLTAAQQAGTDAATTIGGIATGAPTTQQVQDFMSPYQSQVIDATLAEFDRNRQIQEQSIRDQQAALGVLGSCLLYTSPSPRD